MSATIWSRSPRANCSGSIPTGADQLHNNPASYLGMLDPSVYITVPYAPKEQRLKAYIKFLQNVPRAAEQMRANIKTPMATSFVDYAKSAFGGFAEYYPGDGMAAWKGVGTPEDQQALKAATRQCGQGDDRKRSPGSKASAPPPSPISRSARTSSSACSPTPKW